MTKRRQQSNCLNHDGQFDPGDVSAVTSSGETSTFSDVPAGTYAVKIVNQPQYRLTSPSTLPASVVVKAGTTVAGPTIAETQDVLVSGSVINAITGQPLSGFRVYIDLSDSGKWVPADPSVVTASNGQWSFNIALPGTYEIRIVPMTGYETTAPNGGVFTFAVGKSSARIGNVFSKQLIGS